MHSPSEFKTPDSIIAELVSIRAEASKGVSALHDAEISLAEATLEFELAEARAILSAVGTAIERQAMAKIETSELKMKLEIHKAQFNRVRTKLKILEQAQMSVQTQARLIEMMYKTAGIGER
jgi:hypothetical protein